MPNVMAHTCNPSSGKQSQENLSSKPALATCKTFSQKQTKNRGGVGIGEFLNQMWWGGDGRGVRGIKTMGF